jgi:hypothetical protein
VYTTFFSSHSIATTAAKLTKLATSAFSARADAVLIKIAVRLAGVKDKRPSKADDKAKKASDASTSTSRLTSSKTTARKDEITITDIEPKSLDEMISSSLVTICETRFETRARISATIW